jgi:Ribosomal protein S7p/S5e
VDAIVNTGPREDSTRIGSQGTVRRQAVDVSPLRRVNQSVALLTIGVSDILQTYSNPSLRNEEEGMGPGPLALLLMRTYAIRSGRRLMWLPLLDS